MDLVTRQTMANTAAERWRTQYPGGSTVRNDENCDEIHDSLVSLGNTPDPDSVDRVIKNTSWTDFPQCSECNQKVDRVVILGEPPDYESSTAWICLDCLKRAVKLAEEST